MEITAQAFRTPTAPTAPPAASTEPIAFTLPAEPSERRRSSAVGLMVGGLSIIALAVAALATTPHGTHHRAAQAAAASATAPGSAPAATPSALSIQSTGDISVLNMTYEPGQTSGWHLHRGIHAVAVISGSLTVYDQNCVATTYGPGEAYIGGQMLHLVRNEGTEPATMVVTYFNPINPGPAPVAPPAPCDIR